jgi:hypothetical protein
MFGSRYPRWQVCVAFVTFHTHTTAAWVASFRRLRGESEAGPLQVGRLQNSERGASSELRPAASGPTVAWETTDS